MGAALGGAGGSGGRFGRRRAFRPMAEINVTPLVDVMLVLLIIFMVTAPLLQVGVQVDLPKVTNEPIRGTDEPLVISIKADGETYLGETKYVGEELVAKLKAVQQQKPDQRLFVRGDRNVSYGRVMEVMSFLTQSGFQKVALVGETPGGRAGDTKSGDTKGGGAKGAAPATPPASGGQTKK